jgi:hypothetical protein
MSKPSIPSAIAAITRRDDAIALCTALQESVARLTDLMDQETALLADNRHRDIVTLQEEKNVLSRAFLKQFTAFKANAAFIGANTPSQVDRLRKILRAFARCIERNLNSIDAARAVSQGLVQAMFSMASKSNAGPACYGSNAAVGEARTTRPTAIALDRSL